MAKEIRQLPEEVINKIAAGEVIERPASVVKELLENSIDAGADQIEVEYRQGGVRKIEVRDNGAGIAPDELPVALRRHATSKIWSADDLVDIRTLGFRGEALASIAAVADVKIISRHRDAREAVEAKKKASARPEIKPAARAVGTTVRVENLFENIPARKKFLATERTEKKHILQEIQKKILAHPSIHFKVIEDGLEQLHVPPGDLKDRVHELMGTEIADHLLSVDRLEADWSGQGRFGLTGLISNGEAVHHNRRHQFIFVNSRPVREPVIYRAISRAYSDLVLTSKQPVVVLFVDIPGDQLDVNVHPKKEEVRFNNSQEIFRFVYHTLRGRLEEYYQSEARSDINSQDSERLLGSEDFAGDFSDPSRGNYSIEKDRPGDVAPQLFESQEEQAGRARVLGQIKETFLLVERKSGLLIVDQHTAHEKILFEKFRRQVARSDEPAQLLAVPLELDVSPADREVLLSRANKLQKLGLTVEPFGGKSLVIQSVPGYLGRRNEDKRIIFEMIEEFLEWSREDKISNVAESMITIMSCRSAVKRGDRLLPREQQELIEGLNSLKFPAKCPHGRRIYYEIENHELARWFGRPLRELD